mmetsp:Transcript_12011/g.20279  ORF Transcript_12011/g.20279 Transcript_12011/m.20279 type:complete len:185 (+) Transcript_12011:833-1387(+)
MNYEDIERMKLKIQSWQKELNTKVKKLEKVDKNLMADENKMLKQDILKLKEYILHLESQNSELIALEDRHYQRFVQIKNGAMKAAQALNEQSRDGAASTGSVQFGQDQKAFVTDSAPAFSSQLERDAKNILGAHPNTSAYLRSLEDIRDKDPGLGSSGDFIKAYAERRLQEEMEKDSNLSNRIK